MFAFIWLGVLYFQRILVCTAYKSRILSRWFSQSTCKILIQMISTIYALFYSVVKLMYVSNDKISSTLLNIVYYVCIKWPRYCANLFYHSVFFLIYLSILLPRCCFIYSESSVKKILYFLHCFRMKYRVRWRLLRNPNLKHMEKSAMRWRERVPVVTNQKIYWTRNGLRKNPTPLSRWWKSWMQ